MKAHAMVLTVGLVVGTAALGNADLTTDLNSQASTMNNLATSHGETQVTGKIAGDFSSFLGADSNAVVTGLRNGTPITLTRATTVPSTTPGGLPTTATTTTVITRADRPYGARQRLHLSSAGEAAAQQSRHHPTDAATVAGGIDRGRDHTNHRKRHDRHDNDD